MTEFLFHETIIGKEFVARAYADELTGVPTRVEIKGDTKKYRFYFGDGQHKEGMVVPLEAKDTTSYPVDAKLAEKLNTKTASQINWMCGVEGA